MEECFAQIMRDYKEEMAEREGRRRWQRERGGGGGRAAIGGYSVEDMEEEDCWTTNC